MAKLAGPWVDVLKNVVVDGLKVRNIELTGLRLQVNFSKAAGGRNSFRFAKAILVTNVTKIPKNVSPWINVRVHI